MKKRTALILALVASASTTLAAPAFAADVGVSVTIGEPGFYGHIDIGDAPAPQVIYRQPVVIQRSPVAVAPIYLRVPPGQYKHWNRYCAQYNACGQPVYFVRNSWYNNVYAPRYRQQHPDRRYDRDDRRDHGHDRDRGRDDRGDRGRDHDRH